MPVSWRIALVTPPYASLSYAPPEGFGEKVLEEGVRVAVPLGRSVRLGVCLGPDREPPGDRRLKPVIWPLDRRPLLSPAYMEMVEALASRYLVPPGRILATALPQRLRTAQVRIRRAGDRAGAAFSPKDVTKWSPDRLLDAVADWESGRLEVVAVGESGQTELFRLMVDPPWPVRPGATLQIAILEHLFEHGPAPRKMLLSVLGRGAGPALAALVSRSLVAANWGEIDDPFLSATISPACEPVKLDPTGEQAAALGELLPALESRMAATWLLHGVTGSGKTFVYLQLVRRVLETGRSAILLAPEVALACGLYRAFLQAGLGEKVRFHHGYLPPARKEAVFRSVAGAEEPVVVIGTRSAVFLPVRDPGLVILDEEHDESYKQEDGLPYQAKEVGFFLSRLHRSLLVLGSATPDIKTFHAAREGRIRKVSLPGRVGAAKLPDVRLVSLLEQGGGTRAFAKETRQRLRQVVKAGEQAIIMQNRRGYAPIMYCLECGDVLRCPHCQVALTYHKARERVVCHYCGLSQSFPTTCQGCRASHFLPMGEGTEQVEELLGQLLPEDTRLLRLDRDSTRRQERMEQILGDFRKGRAQVLVGTQMLSKGHHFPNVTLVVVVDADLGLNLPDYRSSERAFHLLTQVSGRAGRGELPGEVLIQTRNPVHPFWKFVLEGDYEGFCIRELELRRRFSYPPFVKLGLVRLSHSLDLEGGPEMLSAVASALSEAGRTLGVTVLGPAPAPMATLRGRRRFHCLLKAEDWKNIRGVYQSVRNAAGRLSGGGRLRIALDLDPVNML